MKKTILKSIALLFSGSLVVLFILYQTGSFDPVEVKYRISNIKISDKPLKSKSSFIPNQINDTVKLNSRKKKLDVRKSDSTSNNEKIHLSSSKSALISFDDFSEEEKTRIFSSKTIYIPKKQELESEGTPFNFYFKSLIRNRANDRLLFVDSNFQEEVEKQKIQRMSSSKSLIITKPVKPFIKKK